MKNPETVQAFWERFLQSSGRPANTRYLDCYHFTADETLANELLALTLRGQKAATTSLFHLYELDGDPLPEPGDLSVITGWDGVPRCVIETTAVRIIPFQDMTFDICKREGEDDTLESWRANHLRAFERDEAEYGFTFTWDMPVVFEDFKVIYREGSAL